jgi:hypothetical protein
MLVIRASGKKATALRRNGKVAVRPRITFTPAGGQARTKKQKLKLVKR